MNTRRDNLDTSSISGLSDVSDVSDLDTGKEKERGREKIPELTNLRDSREKVRKQKSPPGKRVSARKSSYSPTFGETYDRDLVRQQEN